MEELNLNEQEKDLLFASIDALQGVIYRSRNLLGPGDDKALTSKQYQIEGLKGRLFKGFSMIKEAVNEFFGTGFETGQCPICHSWHESEGPFWGFVDNNPLCLSCMERFAPEILAKNENKEAWPDWHKEMIAEFEKEERLTTEEDRLPF